MVGDGVGEISGLRKSAGQFCRARRSVPVEGNQSERLQARITVKRGSAVWKCEQVRQADRLLER